MVDKNKIGAFMASLRKENNLTQAELAERLNVSNKSISRWENGQTLPDYDQVLELCRLFNVSATLFLSGGEQTEETESAAKESPEEKAEQHTETPTEPSAEQERKRGKRKAFAIGAAVMLALIGLILAIVISSRGNRIAVDEAHFPDEMFRAMIERTVPHRRKGSFTEEELLQVKSLDCSHAKIRDLTGIGLFPNLETLNCSENELTSIDLSQNPALVTVNCAKNEIAALDVSMCGALSDLNCEENKLTALDVSKNTALTVLKCNDNAIAGLDVTANPKLADLQCYCNPIGNIDVSHNPELEKLDAWEVGFTELDVSNNPKLTYLNCDYSSLTSLDLSNNPDITVLYCAFNQLTELDVSRQTGLKLLSCGNNKLETLKLHPDMPLEFLLCDTNRLQRLDLSQYTNLTYCICCDNPMSELTLSGAMSVDAANPDRFRIAESVMLGPYPAQQDGDGGIRFDLKTLVSPENMDRVTVRTRGVSQPDENGFVLCDSALREFVYVFDTGYHHIGFEVRVILDQQ